MGPSHSNRDIQRATEAQILKTLSDRYVEIRHTDRFPRSLGSVTHNAKSAQVRESFRLHLAGVALWAGGEMPILFLFLRDDAHALLKKPKLVFWAFEEPLDISAGVKRSDPPRSPSESQGSHPCKAWVKILISLH